MYYYEVAIASNKYHGSSVLTYSSEDTLMIGAVVEVPLGKSNHALGFITRILKQKPAFVTKTILRQFPELASMPQESLDLFTWMCDYYPGPLGITAQLFVPKDLPNKVKVADIVVSEKPAKPLMALTDEQARTLAKIDSAGSFILHGETGTGKTRMYIELALKKLDEGLSSIILTPEISLTAQLAQSFQEVFGMERVIVIHSQLTSATRRNIWLRILMSAEPLIIIGARSALFSPLKDIGLIVIDESHEFTYKQENSPHYHASRVASTLASLHQAQLILGSATPSIADIYIAKQKRRPVLRMTQLAKKTEHTLQHSIVDMRDKAQLSASQYLSTVLIAAIQDALSQHGQTMLFLNRRGTARIVLCETCGWQAICPHCDLPLTYHHDSHRLRCHSCNFSQAAVISCPSCGNPDITLKSIGTKAVIENVRKLFPSARIERFDADNLKDERLDERYSDIKAGNVDIIVGTQLLAKGLDLPHLQVVGILNADASLYIPDYTSQERTYQLLTQTMGRIGRGHKSGHAIIQTYTPESPVLNAAVEKNWDTFYENELSERQAFNFPPFCYLLKVSCKRAQQNAAEQAAQKTADMLRSHKLHIEVDGPAPAFHEKIQDKYVWQLIIKSPSRTELIKVISLLPKDWSYDIDPINLL